MKQLIFYLLIIIFLVSCANTKDDGSEDDPNPPTGTQTVSFILKGQNEVGTLICNASMLNNAAGYGSIEIYYLDDNGKKVTWASYDIWNSQGNGLDFPTGGEFYVEARFYVTCDDCCKSLCNQLNGEPEFVTKERSKLATRWVNGAGQLILDLYFSSCICNC